jgi:hypothetical protein
MRQRNKVSGVAIVAILRKARTAQPVRPRCQSSTIVIGEVRSPRPKLAPQKPVFFDQVRDRLPLPAIQLAAEHAPHHLQRRTVDHEAELVSREALKDLGREMEHHYGRACS